MTLVFHYPYPTFITIKPPINQLKVNNKQVLFLYFAFILPLLSIFISQNHSYKQTSPSLYFIQPNMGCTSSSSTEPQTRSLLTRTPQIWFISGGPGSNKGKIIEYLVRDYKYFYLSLFEILQFQKERNTPDSQEIKKSISDKKDFSSELITRLLKKAIASLGPRRYLIDGYPRNLQDIQQLHKQPFLKEVTLMRFINIQVSQQKMKQTGLEAKKDDKRSKDQVQKQVTQVIQQYKKYEQAMVQHFLNKKLLIQIPERESEEETYNELRLEFEDVQNFRYIKEGDSRVFFALFDLPQDEAMYTHQLTKRYGFHSISTKRLLEQAKQKNSNQSKYIKECEEKKEAVSSEFLLHLIRKKIEKKDYLGNFLVCGFPRNINDAEEWGKTFGWEAVVEGLVDFQVSQIKLKGYLDGQQGNSKAESKVNQQGSPSALSPLQKHTKNKRVLCEFYQKQQKLHKITCQDPIQTINLLQNLMLQKGLPKRRPNPKTPPLKIIFMPTINDEPSSKIESGLLSATSKQTNMIYCYENEIKENGLYSELIASYVSAGTPVPGDVAVRVLVKNLAVGGSSTSQRNQPKPSPSVQTTQIGNTILIKGFPNSLEQLIAWNQEVGDSYLDPCVLYFAFSQQKLSQKLTKSKIQFGPDFIEVVKKNVNQLEKYIHQRQIKNLMIAEATTPEQVNKFLETV